MMNEKNEDLRKCNLSPTERLNQKYERIYDIVMVRLDGDLDFYTSSKCRSSLEKVINVGIKKYIMDLTRLDYMDSTGMGFLVSINQEIRNQGGIFICIQPRNEQLQLLIEKSWLPKVLFLVDDEQSALQTMDEQSEAEDSGQEIKQNMKASA